MLPLITTTSLGLALLVSRAVRGVGLFRAIFFLRYVTSTVMTAVIWLWILRPTKSGLLNSLLDSFGYDPVGWLQDQNKVLPALAVMSTWKGCGYSMLILVAGLQAIPQMFQEAARRWCQWLAGLPPDHSSLAQTGPLLCDRDQIDLIVPGLRCGLCYDKRWSSPRQLFAGLHDL
jgi:hypothetical protein